MITINNNNLQIAAKLMLKNDKRDYIKYIVCKDDSLYITNGVFLVSVPANGLDTGLYQVLLNNKTGVSIIKVSDDIESTPDYERMFDDNGYNSSQIETTSVPSWFRYHLAVNHKICIDHKYAKLICDLGLTGNLMVKDERSPLLSICGDIRLAVIQMIQRV